MATQKIQKYCDDFILFLLQERDENQVIMRKIYEEDWMDEDDRENWIEYSLLNYLANGMAYKNVEEGGVENFIPGYDIQRWSQSLMSWRMESNGFYHSLIFHYCYRYLNDRTHDDLIVFLKNLIEENTIMPK
jgi:hypothetical protein